MKWKKSLVFLLAVSAAGVVCAGTIVTPYIAGDWQGWDATIDPMVETGAGSDIWTLSVTGLVANSRHEFKVSEYNWSNSYPGPNSWLYADSSGNITITYDGNSYSDGWSSSQDRIGLSADPGTWVAAGSFQGWDNASAATAMTPMGGGIYSLTINDMAAGTNYWKAVVSGSWDSISWDNRSVGTADWEFITDGVNNDVTFYVDAINGTAKIDVIPEPSTIGLVGVFGLGLIYARRKGKF